MTEANATEHTEHFDIDEHEDELEALKRQADLLGVQYAKNIGVDALRKRVAAALEAKPTEEGAAQPKASEGPNRTQLRDEAAKKIRVRIACHDPMKKEYHGEIFTVMNSVVGVFKEFVQFDEPWHVSNIILQQIQDSTYQQFYTVKDSRGNKVRKGKLVKAYSIEYLPALTKEELEALAMDQRARKAVG
ncbi:hypothetical protein ACXNWJ_002983 [Acinetobacter baumannii]